MKKSVWVFVSTVILTAPVVAQDKVEPGHSKHGSAYDSGLRSRPHIMPGIGKTPFPITTKNPEVQQYFDQAIALIHSFWWEEAERSLRWCVKLEPENPMPYWALALTGDGPVGESGRYRDFLNQAIKFKGKASDREKAFIEAWETAYAKGVPDSQKVLREHLEEIILKYPDDVEAKAQLAWLRPGKGGDYLFDLLVSQVQKVNPQHPGAVHSTIHAWDYRNPDRAITSALNYSKFAPGVGHALHMPGHIFSKVGMWHEAARSMDSATRTELKYMYERLALPFETWNFQHNRNYLSFIQEQLGMANAAIQGARDLLAAPTDPNESNEGGGGFAWQGSSAFIRGCLKFERYDDLLVPGYIPYDKNDRGEQTREWVECLAYAGKKNGVEARKHYAKLKALMEKPVPKDPKAPDIPLDRLAQFAEYETRMLKEAEALVLLAEGNLADGRKALVEVANLEKVARAKEPIAGDPPDSAWSTARILGDFYMSQKEPQLALEAYERALKYEPNCGFALSGLALAENALGHIAKATEYAGRLEAVWDNADKGLRWLEAVRALKLKAKPIAITPRPERAYRPAELAHYGPSNWEPYAAPKLECLNVNGKPVTLADYRGKNILLVFYLNEECVHCVEQLTKINARMPEFEKENTVVLGVSSTTPALNLASLKLGKLGVKLLSDQNHENARRFASYDDFEDMELHSTILIDGAGRVRWKRSGGDPFSDVDYLLREIRHFKAR